MLGTTLLLFTMAAVGSGYLYVEFTRTSEASLRITQDLARRDTALHACFEVVLRLEQAIGRTDSLDPDILGQTAATFSRSVDHARSVYSETLQRLSGEDARPLNEAAGDFFRTADDLTAYLRPGSVASATRADSMYRYAGRLAESLNLLTMSERALHRIVFQRSENMLRAVASKWFVAILMFLGLVIWFMLSYARKHPGVSEQQEPAHTLLEFSTSPVLVLDSGGAAVFVNPAFERWGAVSRNDLQGKHLFDYLSVSGYAAQGGAMWDTVHRSLEGGKEWSAEVEWQWQTGAKGSAAVVISPVVDGVGRLVEAIALFTDLSDRREYARRLQETQRQYQNIVESSLDGIVVVQEGSLRYANPTAVAIFGYSSSNEMQTVSISDSIPSSNRPILSLRPDGRAIGEDILKNYELRGVTKQGKLIDLEVNARVIEWNGLAAVQASFRDITERKALERDQALWLWEQETLSDIDRKLVGIVNLSQILDSILQQTLNLTRAHWAGVLLIDDQTAMAQWRAVKGNKRSVTTDQFPLTPEITRMFETAEPLILQELGGGIRPSSIGLPDLRAEQVASACLFPLLVEKKARGLLAVGFRHFHDFAGREIRLLMSLAEKNAIALANGELYENLVERERELELLSGARVQAQEEERRRISREIHDGLGQMLTAIKFNLEILEDSVQAGDDERKRIDDMKNLLDNVMKEAREISYDLMPSVLVDFGLAPALQLLCEQFAARVNIPVEFQAHGLIQRLDPKIEVGVYRIAQEALNNIAKHASAAGADVQVIRHATGLTMTIEDDGRGMDVKTRVHPVTDKGGMGLVSMRDRAATLRGTLQIDSTPGHGTLISVEIPISS